MTVIELSEDRRDSANVAELLTADGRVVLVKLIKVRGCRAVLGFEAPACVAIAPAEGPKVRPAAASPGAVPTPSPRPRRGSGLGSLSRRRRR